MKKFVVTFFLLITFTSLFSQVRIGDIYYKLYPETKEAGVTKNIMIDTYTMSSLTIPEKVTYQDVDYVVTRIEQGAFSRNYNIKKITLPQTLFVIGKSAFYDCNITEISIPASVSLIEMNAFYASQRLEKVIFDDGSEELIIGENAFGYCSNLKSLTLGYGLTEIGPTAFECCINLQSVSIPNTTTKIGAGAFYYCGLTKVLLGKNIQSIEEIAFGDCAKLVDLYCFSEDVPSIKDNTFRGLKSCTLHVYANLIDSYKTTNYWSVFPNILALTDEEIKLDIKSSKILPYIISYYTLDGKQLTEPRKGLYIVKLSDGSKKKVINYNNK